MIWCVCGQFCRGKSFDTFCPLSEPVIASQVADPQNLRIVTKLNGNEMQNESTKAMIFSVKQIISQLSIGTTLLEGTVILTGTPSGVGDARKPPVYLKHGDVVEISIEGVGNLSNHVIEE